MFIYLDLGVEHSHQGIDVRAGVVDHPGDMRMTKRRVTLNNVSD